MTSPRPHFGVRLTDRQWEVVNALVELTCRLGMPPTVRELAAALDISSPNGMMCHINALVDKGFLSRTTSRATSRHIQLTPAAEAHFRRAYATHAPQRVGIVLLRPRVELLPQEALDLARQMTEAAHELLNEEERSDAGPA